jgi:hypothetical protein
MFCSGSGDLEGDAFLRWSAEAWAEVRVEFRRALALSLRERRAIPP